MTTPQTRRIALLAGVFLLGAACAPEPGPVGPEPETLHAPTGLSTQAASKTSVTLTWSGTQDNPDDAALELERALFEAGPFDPVVALAGTESTYTDDGLLPDLAYWYRLRATRDAGAEATEWTGPVRQVLPPREPTDVVAVAVTDAQVELSWTNASNVAEGFVIERQTEGGAFEELDTLEVGETTYTDDTTHGERDYTYRMHAFNEGGESDAIAAALVTTPIARPTNLKANTPTATQLVLTWDDNSEIEVAYHVASAISPNGAYTGFNVAADSTEATINGLTPGATSYWRIHAVTSEGEASEFAGPIEVTMPPAQ